MTVYRALAIHEHLCLLNSWLIHMNKWCSVDSYRDFFSLSVFCLKVSTLEARIPPFSSVKQDCLTQNGGHQRFAVDLAFVKDIWASENHIKYCFQGLGNAFLKTPFVTSIELLVSMHVTPKFFELLLPKSICSSQNVGLKILTA